MVAYNRVGASIPAVLNFRQATVPNKVTQLRVGALPGAGRATVLWTPAVSGGSPVLGYRVAMSGPNTTTYGPWVKVGTPAHTLAGLRTGATYRILVVAYNTQGQSAAARLAFVAR